MTDTLSTFISDKAATRFGICWAVLILLCAALLPPTGGWTIDDGVKRIAAQQGEGLWAETLPDGPIRSHLADPGLGAPLRAPFVQRTPHAVVFGFSPWTRALFNGLWSGGTLVWRLFPAMAALLVWAFFERRGMRFAFLLLPLTFYAWVPWEHGLSWLLLLPAAWAVVRDLTLAKDDTSASPCHSLAFVTLAGLLLGLAVALRPETAILAGVLTVALILKREWPRALALAGGAAVGLGALLLWHDLTTDASPFAQIALNWTGAGNHGLWHWPLARLEAAYELLLRCDALPWLSVLLLACLAAGTMLLMRAENKKSKTTLYLALGLLAAWTLVYEWRLWSSPLPVVSVMAANSLVAALPWVLVLLKPPYSGRPALILALAAFALTFLIAPVWEGVHWGPRLLLFALPLLVFDLHFSGRARGWVFSALLAITVVQTAGSGLLVFGRTREIADRVRLLESSRLGSPVICPTMSQCADLAALWPEREFFTASEPAELRRLLIEMRYAGVDTVWLHTGGRDSLFAKTFPSSRPVWPHVSTLIRTRPPVQTTWRLLELVMSNSDTAWAGPLESEAGRLMSLNRPEEALRMQRGAVTLTPDVAMRRSNLALIYYRLGRTSEARNEAETALRLKPDLRESRLLLQILSRPPAVPPGAVGRP